MTPVEAWKVVHQIARTAPVPGDVGDARDEALEILRQLAETEVRNEKKQAATEKPKSKHQ